MARGSPGGLTWLRDGRLVTRGHAEAVATVAAWGRHGVPHAILVAGPASVGKATLARDLAAALLCTAGADGPVPCGRCGACARVASGNHPDLHVLRPVGAGGQIRIGDSHDPEPGTARHLIRALALSSAEGGARVALVESAHRMNDDAQNALLRTLEEPPPGVVIVLCADDEDRLLSTIRSRCVRVRLGPVSSRAIEHLLGELGLADPPAAARLARLAEGRPGVAIALARRPDAVRAREELLRRLLDLTGVGPAARLMAGPSLLAAARTTLAGGAEVRGVPDGSAAAPGAATARAGGGRGRSRPGRPGAAMLLDGGSGGGASPVGRPAMGASGVVAGRDAARAASDGDDAPSADEEADAAAEGEPGAGGRRRRQPVAERREAARALIDAWRVVARDLAVAAAGGRRELRDAALMEEVGGVASRLPAGSAVTFLARLEATERLVEANAGPELAIDTLLLAWPRATPGAAALAEASAGVGRADAAAGSSQRAGAASAAEDPREDGW